MFNARQTPRAAGYFGHHFGQFAFTPHRRTQHDENRPFGIDAEVDFVQLPGRANNPAPTISTSDWPIGNLTVVP
jgi:hypothetical protein